MTDEFQLLTSMEEHPAVLLSKFDEVSQRTEIVGVPGAEDLGQDLPAHLLLLAPWGLWQA